MFQKYIIRFNRVSKIDLCLAYVKSFKWIDYFVIGFISHKQFEEILLNYKNPKLRKNEVNLINNEMKRIIRKKNFDAKFMEKLKNKKFLITGATGHLGRVISEQIVNEGADVILLSNNFKRLKLVKKSLEKKYDSHIDIIKCNLFDLKALKNQNNYQKKNILVD